MTKVTDKSHIMIKGNDDKIRINGVLANDSQYKFSQHNGKLKVWGQWDKSLMFLINGNYKTITAESESIGMINDFILTKLIIDSEFDSIVRYELTIESLSRIQ